MREIRKIAWLTVLGFATAFVLGCPSKTESKSSGGSGKTAEQQQADKKKANEKKPRVEEKYGFTTESAGDGK